MQVAGMAVKPGDLLHGDENGLITVPECNPESLAAAVESVRARERKLMECARSPECTLADLLQRFRE